MATKAIEPVESGKLTKQSIERTVQTLDLLQEMVQSVLTPSKKGHSGDYGKIPGIDKDTLFKPGAATLISAFQCRPEPHIVGKEINQETGFISIDVRVDAVGLNDDRVKCSGLGSCTSFERKYHYRKGDVIASGQDMFDQYNTIVKMAEKRALVGCAMLLPGVSRFFTQDMDDPDLQRHVSQEKQVQTVPVGGICPLHNVAFNPFSDFKTGKPGHRHQDGVWDKDEHAGKAYAGKTRWCNQDSKEVQDAYASQPVQTVEPVVVHEEEPLPVEEDDIPDLPDPY